MRPAMTLGRAATLRSPSLASLIALRRRSIISRLDSKGTRLVDKESRVAMFQKPLPRRARLPLSFIPPMKPLLVDEPPGGEDWIHEIKYDGWRLQLIIADDIRAFTKNGIDYSRQLRPIIEATRSLGARDTILDGELIIQGDDGRSDFHGLRSAMTNAPERLIFYAFDMMVTDGQDIRAEACVDRRHRLCNLIGDHDPTFPIQFSDHFVGGGGAVFVHAEALGLEGIVSKKASSRYRRVRRRHGSRSRPMWRTSLSSSVMSAALVQRPR